MRKGKGKVLVAMSGGVDSSVAAALLRDEGYEVVGCFMRLGSPGETFDQPIADGACDLGGAGKSAPAKPLKIGHQGCCSVGDAADARLVAAELGVPFYVVNFKKEFGRIIDYFADEYVRGRTPNPCVRCNDWLKFGKLHEYARQIGADFVASGHYARVAPDPRGGGEARLMRGVDHAKDQSYVLFGVPRAQLAHTLMPIGAMEKPRVRELAQRYGLPVFDKPDSQEICFVPDNDYAGLVERHRPDAVRPGAVVDTSGAVVGSHEGQHHFTLGQRRGVNVALGYPVYVVGKDPVSGTVMVGSRQALEVDGCVAHEANWLVDPPPADAWTAVLARYRSSGALVRAEARALAGSYAGTPSGRDGAFEVRFSQPQVAVTPGQAVVLYDAGSPEVVVGGGWIASTTRMERAGS